MKNKKESQERLDIGKHPQDMPASVLTPPTKMCFSEQEWKLWLTENASKLLMFARQQTRSSQDAEDVLQEALIRLSQKLQEGTFVGTQENWLPYLYTSIRRISIDMGRNQDRRRKREELTQKEDFMASPHEQGELPWFEAVASDDYLQQVLRQELEKLPSKFSEVISLKIWGDATFQQIADTLDLSINTVASRYRYGLEQLKKALQKHRDAYYE